MDAKVAGVTSKKQFSAGYGGNSCKAAHWTRLKVLEQGCRKVSHTCWGKGSARIVKPTAYGSRTVRVKCCFLQHHFFHTIGMGWGGGNVDVSCTPAWFHTTWHVSGTCSRCILAKLRVAERKEVSTSNMQGAKISTFCTLVKWVFTVFEQIDLIWVHFFELFLSLFMWDETAILFQNTCKLCVSQIGEGECKNAGSVFNPAVFHRLGQRLKPCSQSLEDFCLRFAARSVEPARGFVVL